MWNSSESLKFIHFSADLIEFSKNGSKSWAVKLKILNPVCGCKSWAVKWEIRHPVYVGHVGYVQVSFCYSLLIIMWIFLNIYLS